MSTEKKDVLEPTATEKEANGIEKVETVEMVAEKTAKEQEAPTTEEKIVLSEKQKELVSAAINERRFLQEETQKAFKREGEIVALVVDAAGFDNMKVVEAKITEDGQSLLLKVLEVVKK